MLIFLLLSVLFAWLLQKAVYRAYWDKNLQVQVSFVDAYVYEGDTSALREEIANDKKLPLPALEVRLAVDRSLQFIGDASANTNVTDLSYKRDVFSFLFHQKVIHTLSFTCRKRGFYQISNVEVVGYDLLFRTQHYLNAPQQTLLYVYPAQIDAARIRLICREISGMVLVQNRLYPDPFEFSGIREYRRDPMRHINWKASARSSSLMVNQFDSTTSIRATVILDVEDSRILRSESLTEEGIRIASSLAARMVRQNMELRLVSNAVLAENPGKQLDWHARPAAARIHELNRMLACVDIHQDATPVSDLLRKELSQRLSGQIYVLISKNQDSIAMDLLRALAAGNEILWIIPVEPKEPLAHAGAPGIRLMRWEVSRS